MQNEESLVRRAQGGDKKALAELYELNFDRVYRYLFLRLGNRAEAEDLSEEVFLRMIEKIGSYRWRGAPFSAWLFRIGHNLAVDRLRRRPREEALVVEDLVVGEMVDPLLGLELKEELVRLQKALKDLTDLQRQVITLRFAAELPIAEVARIMGKKEGAVKALQHSALASLRRLLAQEG